MRIDGTKLGECFYLRDDVTCGFRKVCATLGAYFSQDFRAYARQPARRLPLFAFYKSDVERADWRPGQDYERHPMDFDAHEVRIVVSELDRVKMPPRAELSKLQWRRLTENRPRREILEIMEGNYYWHRHSYTLGLFDRLKEDERILFCYVSTSGVGLRVAFYSAGRLNRDSYIDLQRRETDDLLRRYDTAKLLRKDYGEYVTENYWFVPTSGYVYVNPDCHAL